MQFDECDDGDYRIYVGALEAPGGDGFIAAVVVQRVRGIAGPPREIWRDDSLACGHHWPSADAALRYAMTRARDMLRQRAPVFNPA